MKVAVCQKPNEMEIKEIEKPVAKEGEALVRIRRIGICGSDLHAFKGEQPYFTYPRVLGHELAAEIESLPEGSHGLATGDPVAVLLAMDMGADQPPKYRHRIVICTATPL